MQSISSVKDTIMFTPSYNNDLYDVSSVKWSIICMIAKKKSVTRYGSRKLVTNIS